MKNKKFIDIHDISAAFLYYVSDGTEKEMPACHDRYEILYVTSGQGRIIVEGKEFCLVPKVLFLTRPFEYGTITLDGKSNFEIFDVKFQKSALSYGCSNILDSIINEDDCGGVYYSVDIHNNDFNSVFERFAVAQKLPEKEQAVMARALVSEIIALLSAIGGKKFIKKDDTLFSKVTTYINSNIQKDLSLDALSHRFFVSKYYLCRTFKQQSGTSIHNYINQKRVLYAKQLIESGETAARAAEAVGFGDYSAFYRAYTKYQGVSPASVKVKGGNL